MLCAKCNYDNPADALFCMKCGTKVENRCSSCNTVNPADANFCRKCGDALGAGAPASSRSPAAAANTPRVEVTHERQTAEGLEGERKTVTALFADIKGSTEMMEDLDPENARAIIDPALTLMMDAVHRYDGYVVQSTGDGIFALFGAPLAHEDHPQRALYAALRMQEELRRYSAKVVADGGTPIQGRIGINSGEVVVRSIQTGAGHVEYTPIGHTTNLAARMQTAARVGSIAVTEAARKLCEGYFILKPLGATKVKGVSEPVNVYEVTGLGPLRTRLQRSAGRGYTKFVGRQREMEAMKHAAEQAKAGRGQIVAAMAEPGVGKSRLFFEFKAVSQSGWMVLETFSVSHGKASAYLPVIDLLWNYFEISTEDDERKRRERVNGKVLTLDRSLEDTLPYLFALLGIVEGDDPLAQMDAQVRRQRTLGAIKRIILRESLNQPLMVIFEDLHWIDDETQALLTLLADSIATAKILILVNYRPEYSHAWGSKTYYTQLRLDPLGKEFAEEMLSSLVGVGKDLIPLKRLIIEKAEGTPFFMEEIVQALFEDGVLQRNGAVKLARSMNAVKVPTTVQAILASRIDRLPPTHKDLLQTLGVIGREFPLALVRALAVTADAELERMLEHLQLAEFIYEQPAAGGIEYTFKHALTQEVAYNSLLAERRRSLHERIGGAIEALFAERLDDHLPELALHFSRSGSASKATHYLVRAAEDAIGRSAYDEATAALRTGLILLERIPDQQERAQREAALQTALGSALSVRGATSAGVEAALLRARELCAQCGDGPRLFRVLEGLRLCYTFRAELGKALDLGQELLAVAERAGDSGMMASAHAGVGLTLYFRGELPAAKRHVEAAIGLTPAGRELSHIRMRSEPRSRLALLECLSGYPARAAQTLHQARRLVQERRDPLGLMLIAVHTAQFHFLIRDVRQVGLHSETGMRLGSECGNAQAWGYSAACRGWFLAISGNPSEGIAEIRRAIETLDRVGAGLRNLPFAQLAECHLISGEIDEGLEVLAAALVHAEESGERFGAAELTRLRGELLLIRQPSEAVAAEAPFRTAIDVSRGQQAKWWELRATTSLARLLTKQGRREEARSMLADIYGWFTEGFDTADLKDARALLDELNA